MKCQVAGMDAELDAVMVKCPDGVYRHFEWENIDIVYRGVVLDHRSLTITARCDGMADATGRPVAQQIKINVARNAALGKG